MKAIHAQYYALKLKEKENETIIYFGRLGEKILVQEPEYIKPLLNAVRKEGLIYGICGYCVSSPHLSIAAILRSKGHRLMKNEHEGISKILERSYQIILFSSLTFQDFKIIDPT